jgi:hypothetical protein
MLLAKKKRIIYNGSEYFITIKKCLNIWDIIFFPFALIFGVGKYYKIKVYITNESKLYDFTFYKRILKLKADVNKFENDIDQVIDYACKQLEESLKETKYINNYETSYIIDKEWENKLYTDFYSRVINDLKEKGIIDKELFTEEKVVVLNKPTPPPIKRVWK